MARLPPPLPPPLRRVPVAALASLAKIDDAESLAKTVERRPARSLPTALLRTPRVAIAAAVWTACVIAGITGVIVGHSRPARAHASVAVQSARTPRAAVVVEASEEITQLPLLAPGKVVESPIESPIAATSSAAARPLRRSGFGHMGADRVASGAAARRSASHRR
jgi:hypothetical protein